MSRSLVSLLLAFVCFDSLFARTVLVREVLRPKDMYSSAFVTVADFDGDGDSDWLRSTNSALLVYRANGDGTFAAPVSTPTTSLSLQTFLTAGDVNGDGRTDLLYKTGTNSGRVLLGGVAGGLTAGATLASAGTNFGVARIADVTGDGHADIVANGLCVFAGNGAGGFAAAVTTSESSSSFELGDANGDGASDLFGVSSNQLSVRLAQPGGTWSAHTTFATAAFLALADFDGDGDLDVATDSRMFFGDGNGAFKEGAAYTFPAMQRLVAADLNGDGRADLLAEYSERVLVRLNDGDGTFGAVRGYHATGGIVHDFDGDGHVDLIGKGIVSMIGTSEGIALGNGDGTFRANASYPITDVSCGATPVAAADVTGDGKPDVITMGRTVTGSSFLTVLPSLGDGTFGTRIDTPVIHGGNSIFPRHLNGDAQMDLIVESSARLCVYLGDGDGTFTAGPCTDSSAASRIFIDDFDGDGQDDALTPSPDGVRIYPGLGASGFGAAIQPGLPGYGSVADFNADGDPDYVVSGFGITTVHYGAAGATFTSPGVVIQTGQTQVQDIDMDGDGASDLLLWKFPTLTILPGVPGSMTFGPARQITTEDWTGALPVAADLDGDGARDMVSYTTMLRGDGNGGFAETAPMLGTHNGFALADFDGNGTDDVVTVHCPTVNVRLTGKDAWADLAMTFGTYSGETTYSGGRLGIVYSPVSDTAYVPQGSFTVRENGVLLGYELVDGFNGPAIPLTGGTHVLDVEYSGDAYFAPVSVTTTVIITEGTATLNATAPSTVASGATVTVSATLTHEYSEAALPTGTITVREGAAVFETKPAAETVSFTLGPLAPGTHTLTVEYSGDTNYLATSDTVDVTVSPFDAAIAVTATALTTTSIAVSWTPVASAVSYDVYRRIRNGPYALAMTVTEPSWTDTGRLDGTTHFYQVLARNAFNETTPLSPPDLATTYIFTDPSLAGVRVKARHVTQLQTAINAVRGAAGLAPFTFTQPPAVGSVVTLSQLTQMRNALTEARTALGFTTPLAGVTAVIQALHLVELRDGVK